MEQWKDVKGFEGLYEISSLGNLRSKEKYVNHYRGGKRLYKSKIKKQRLSKSGYLRCNIKHNGKRFDLRVHRLVAMAFLPNSKNKEQVNHINGIKTDNRAVNLEWCTQSENVIHAVENRLIKTKLTDKQALEIFNSEKSTRKLGQEYGVSSSIVWRIKNKKAYKHLFV